MSAVVVEREELSSEFDAESKAYARLWPVLRIAAADRPVFAVFSGNGLIATALTLRLARLAGQTFLPDGGYAIRRISQEKEPWHVVPFRP